MANKFVRLSSSERLNAPQKTQKARLICGAIAVVACFVALAIFWPWKIFDIGDNGILSKTNITHTFNSKSDVRYQEFGVEIPKIGLSAPVTANVNGDDKKEYELSLTEGLAHYKGTSLPGEKSNIFIFGHSSSDTDSGPYAKIFSKLNNLTNGDKIMVYYKSKKYEYTVVEKKIVTADDLSPLNLTDSEQLTLMTCWPIGTNEKRLIVIAK
jgi:LPXTG-site transpeptidase (sortase) family protein